MRNKRSWLRFGIGTLLFLMACTAGYLTGFRFGVEEKQEQVRQQTVSTRIYDVGDLVSLDPDAQVSLADFDSLVDLIVSTVASDSWVENGGPAGEIRPFPKNKSLVVSASGAVHDDLSDLLSQLRRGAYELDPQQLMAVVREISARKLATPHAVKLYNASNSSVHQLVSGHYQSGLALLTKRLGKPQAAYTLDTKEFPTWIAAQQVAVWKQGDSKLFLAHQDVLPEGEALVVGWYEDGMATIRPLSFVPAVADSTGHP
ncbi:hypothetical protein NG895_18890 [Aeoliella sp. ICT_H6.2]|uniref:Uncharacterized protein n=1 Tax=Aeoliella straminimaris TaxID=2954799 RepID=A0A9X2JHM3_9BACT|nr:hypothetical protein [Aeoliella straminimaris]MCO6045971.1 hypothetical protein [Aeoliella straminimaris]